MNSIEKEYLSWTDYGDAGTELANQIKEDDFIPDIILGIARGDLSIASSLGYALGIKNIYIMNVEGIIYQTYSILNSIKYLLFF